MDGFESIQTPFLILMLSDSSELEIGDSEHSNLSQELVTPYHLLNARADKNQFFSYYNYSNNSFLSHGLNGSWAMGVFQDL